MSNIYGEGYDPEVLRKAMSPVWKKIDSWLFYLRWIDPESHDAIDTSGSCRNKPRSSFKASLSGRMINPSRSACLLLWALLDGFEQ